MHIAHLVTRLLRAGSEENTMETCRWQVGAGHEVTLIHGAEFDPYWYEIPAQGVRMIAVPELVHPVRPLADLRACFALRNIYRRLQPDVIHTHQSKAGILGRLAAGVVPDAVVAHGTHIAPFLGVGPAKRALYLAAERLAARKTDVFISVSKAIGAAYVEAGIAPAADMYCVRSGMDLARFRSGRIPDDWRRLLGVPAGNRRPMVALMLAAFEPRKRHVPFLRAFARVAGVLPDLKLLLAGAGPEEARVRAEVAALGLANKVVFCGHRPDPEALLSLADVSVLASEREGLPRVAVQSVAAGCPVVMSDLPGLEEIVHDGINGSVFPNGDLDGLAAGLVRLLSDDLRLGRLRRGARATDVSSWSRDRLGSETTALYGRAETRLAA